MRVADEDQDLTALAEADRTLGYRDVICLQGVNRGPDP
jgi:hypothetical protein